MTRGEAWFFRLAAITTGASGVVLLALRTLVVSEDPFAVVSHPWEPTVQHLHVLAAPLLVFAAGLLWRGHVLDRLARREESSRPSGWVLLLTLAPMIASGYLLQVSVEEGWRLAWTWVHRVSSGIWLLGYGGHTLLRARKARGRASGRRPGAGREGAGAERRETDGDPPRPLTHRGAACNGPRSLSRVPGAHGQEARHRRVAREGKDPAPDPGPGVHRQGVHGAHP